MINLSALNMAVEFTEVVVVNDKYTRRYSDPYPELPQPLRMLRILADEESFNHNFYCLDKLSKSICLIRAWYGTSIL